MSVRVEDSEGIPDRESIVLTVDTDGIAVIRFNRPNKFNAFRRLPLQLMPALLELCSLLQGEGHRQARGRLGALRCGHCRQGRDSHRDGPILLVREPSSGDAISHDIFGLQCGCRLRGEPQAGAPIYSAHAHRSLQSKRVRGGHSTVVALIMNEALWSGVPQIPQTPLRCSQRPCGWDGCN